MQTSPLLKDKIYDIAVIGGGINGVGIAADAAGRGLSVFLCEKDDLASHTSSASSKLIHGGLRYLEHKEFRLVREALAEREVLLAKAPHIIRPMRFIMPHRPHLRPAWLIRTGLFFYDHLGKREKLLGSNNVYFKDDSPLNSAITRGFEYSDCAVDDSRLVVLNAMHAREKGADVVTRTRCLSAQRVEGYWVVELENAQGSFKIKAKALVNAAGPWVAQFIKQDLELKSPYGIRLIQGSHIVVPKLYEGDKAFIMQNDDRRIVFAIPYLDQYTMIGTTDREYQGDPSKVQITQAETDYLLEVSNAHFKKQLTQADIIWTFAGVRPLCDDESDNPSAITRDYTLALSQETHDQAPLLSVFGGKLTTYRKLAESAMQQLKAFFPEMKGSWTATEALPGGENMASAEQLVNEIRAQITDVSESLAKRWATSYGSRIWNILGEAVSIDQLGLSFGHGLFAKEVDYLCRFEWVTTSEDILWRRSKLGLVFAQNEIDRLDAYLSNKPNHIVAA
ncbi:MAG: glycerol-3-phosphate dehydrogenase [Acinetobacter sp. GWC1_38_13]|jgi:glycerol-3-phosphate dehydrogenase|uniref:Glycerol-3-phosphate dehydrogenase n=1 Tax=Acinetobacter junii SH205 TaxID=575587 RepID=D0SM49_ACIJU|nr:MULTISPECIES: glycerol-3-phosphate dehydrogenase [Acinetobacter]MBQ1495410.1 glycerol-3-phosphate dehydrogenase [Acinetobacter sp.]EEY93106.1 glycerol-3-phosphate dehydrogenase [Acinetobacter junii SH205]MDH0718123.1 glycerol-3-phosphate dehydrogenase [Acinetobacter junii]MDH1004471.1 glycerol-3-phosphate dehydrogenase [Acinetobacter junii]OFW43192.1 MAG: glycerol-3-phosphate dehydrogenase [Acinetobacter sp. GWC1_38_13]